MANKLKQEWKQCETCGLVTDLDEIRCPSGNLVHHLRNVQLAEEEIAKFFGERMVYTKHAANLQIITKVHS